MTSITASPLSVSCSRWACQKPLLEGDAQQHFSRLGAFKSCPLLPHSRKSWCSSRELAKSCAVRPVLVSAVTDTTEAIEKDVSTSEEPILASPDRKPVRRRRQGKKEGAESGEEGAASVEVAASAGAEANPPSKRQRGRPQKSNSSEASPAGGAEVVGTGESSEAGATIRVDDQAESEPVDAKQGGQKKRVYSQDAKRLKVSTKRAGKCS